MDIKRKYGQLALVAGASEGIGAAFANNLAAEGMDLILVARRKEPLYELADSLIQKHKVQVQCINCDLSEFNAA